MDNPSQGQVPIDDYPSTGHHFGSSIDNAKIVSRHTLGPSCGNFRRVLENSYPDVYNINIEITSQGPSMKVSLKMHT